jgi:hypothetical protein
MFRRFSPAFERRTLEIRKELTAKYEDSIAAAKFFQKMLLLLWREAEIRKRVSAEFSPWHLY